LSEQYWQLLFGANKHIVGAGETIVNEHIGAPGPSGGESGQIGGQTLVFVWTVPQAELSADATAAERSTITTAKVAIDAAVDLATVFICVILS